jgi:3-phenylpropionate/cinnamic acid dioxygenase small subunit
MFEDWHSIHTLLMLYAERIDSADFAGAAALFAHGTYLLCRSGETLIRLEGAAQAEAGFARAVHRYPDGTLRTQHVITNVIIDLKGDTATSRCYCTVFQATDAFPLQPIAAGRYHDRFERVDGTWRFAERVFVSHLIGDLGAHVDRAGNEPKSPD